MSGTDAKTQFQFGQSSWSEKGFSIIASPTSSLTYGMMQFRRKCKRIYNLNINFSTIVRYFSIFIGIGKDNGGIGCEFTIKSSHLKVRKYNEGYIMVHLYHYTILFFLYLYRCIYYYQEYK